MKPALIGKCPRCNGRVYLCLSPLHWSDWAGIKRGENYRPHSCESTFARDTLTPDERGPGAGVNQPGTVPDSLSGGVEMVEHTAGVGR